jgi:transcriptional regulator with XRE-family HTH domain
MTLASDLSWRLLRSRRDLEWRQEDLANASGVSRTYISEIERGRITNVGIEAIFSLAAALGVTVPYLLGLTDNPLGEDPDTVLKEQSAEYLVIDLDEDQDRRTVRQLIDDYMALSSSHRRMALSYLHMMRQIEEEDRERENKPPRIVGGKE